MQRSAIKTMAAAAVAILGTLPLAACGSGGTSASGSSGQVTIKVAYQKTSAFYQLDDLLTKSKQEFEAATPGVTIELEPIEAEEDQYYTKLALMNGSAATAPDVIYEDTFQVRSDAAAGYLAPIDDYLANWADWSQFPDNAKQAGAGDDGKTYGVSMGSDTRGIFFNKTIFEKAGLPTDWQPKTWNDILAAARTIKQKVSGVIPLNLYSSKAAGEATSMQGFEMLLYGTKNQLLDPGTGKWLTNSTGFTDSLAFIQTVFSEKLGPSMDLALDAKLGSRVSTELLPKGKLAIAIDGSWLPGQWMKGDAAWPEWETTMGYAKMPTQSGQEPGAVSMSGGWLLSVGAQSKNPQVAFNFIANSLNKENSLKYDTENAQIAVRNDVAADPAYTEANPSFGFFSSLMAVTNFRPATPDYPEISQNIQVACESVATGQATPEQASKTYDSALTKIVGQANTQAAG